MSTALTQQREGTRTSRPGFALTMVALSTLMAMSVWFSATFVVGQLQVQWSLSTTSTALLTIAVQIGFVLGACTASATGLADAVSSRKLMCAGAIGAAASNALLLLAPGPATAIALRLLTGVFLAAVYPPAMKEVSTWFQSARGTALGVMIGALTLGSALPHLVNAFDGLHWRQVIGATSLMTLLAAATILTIRGTGPYPFPRRAVSIAGAVAALHNRGVALANLGYIGHMWELYAMWAYVGTFLATLPGLSGEARSAEASGLAFACIGIGALGCLAGGVLSDRRGRAQAALLSLIFSGASALVLALTYSTLPTAAVVLVCAFWGFWVIADSAQFSALVTESAGPTYVGSALSLQMALGYLTTTLTLWLVPKLATATSWHIALGILAAGPALGVLAMRASISHQREGARLPSPSRQASHQ